MGQMANMDRSYRFIQEFNADLAKSFKLQPGMTLRVLSVSICTRDCSEEVAGYATLELPDGDTATVELDTGVIFDPEYGEVDALTSDLAERLDVTEDIIAARLINADLAGPDDF